MTVHEGTCTAYIQCYIIYANMHCVCFIAIKHFHYNYTFAAKRQTITYNDYLLVTIVGSTDVSEVAVLNVVTIEENSFPTDVGVTGTVERQ